MKAVAERDKMNITFFKGCSCTYVQQAIVVLHNTNMEVWSTFYS